ncbi:MAG: hypothetical protein HY675_19635 [Chloroflexi bacterium]|nr:hypothetical protein [Chloroflexota bacterium]
MSYRNIRRNAKKRMASAISRHGTTASLVLLGVLTITLFTLSALTLIDDVRHLVEAAGGAVSAQWTPGPAKTSSLTARVGLPLVSGSTNRASAVSSVYSDALGDGWENASWDGTVDFAQGSVVRAGSRAVMWTPTPGNGGWGAFSLWRQSQAGELDIAAYTNFRFHIRGGAAPEKAKKFGVSLNGSAGPRIDIMPYLEGGSVSSDQWRLVDVPLSAFRVSDGRVARVIIQDTSGVTQPPTYFDDIEFYNNGAAPPPSTVSVTVDVDAGADVHPISPLIYGISTSGGALPYFRDMGVSLVRWGGNARTRHNWEINASNAGSDWEFRNLAQAGGDTTPGKASVDFVNRNKAAGAESLITIPTIGWVARDGNNNSRSTNVPREGGPPLSPGSEAIAGYDATTNRNATSVRSFARKNGPFVYPPNAGDGTVYQDEWVSYLKSSLGGAQNGGVRLYAMDNEADAWADDTHVDVHPVRVGYDEALSRFLEYAEAVKAVDSGAEVTGPVGWGWTSLWYSALDRGNDGFATHADRIAHGDVPFLPWFLQQAQAHDEQTGRRSLDVLDVHFGPQGNLDDAKRLRSARSLWDATYADDSWMGRGEGGPYLRLIPRLKEWIAAYYPGTKLGMSEWYQANGVETKMVGALAVAEVLGTYGREDLYFATYWGVPAEKSPAYWAWRMYRNYDGAYSRFGDVSVRAQTSDLENVSVYASKDSASGELKILLINKMSQAEASVTMSLGNFDTGNMAKIYEYAKNDLGKITELPDVAPEAGRIQVRLSPYSITLVVLGPSTTTVPAVR